MGNEISFSKYDHTLQTLQKRIYDVIVKLSILREPRLFYFLKMLRNYTNIFFISCFQYFL